ncbi:MAG: hypothetical protein U1E49_11445 [Hyphomicrobiaceae bacterium]
MSHRLTTAFRTAANADLVYTLWHAGPRRDIREIVSNSYGGRPAMQLAAKAMKTIDMAALREAAARIAAADRKVGKQKYLSIGAPLARAAAHAISLGLDRSRGKRTLDLGTGAGFLPFVCGYLGHEAKAIDLAGQPLYDALIGVLGVDRTVHRIEAGKPLPDLGRRFSAVTALQVMFDHTPGDVWGEAEWDWLLGELSGRHLEPDGRVLIGLNDRPQHAMKRARVAALFAKCGAVEVPYAVLMSKSGIDRR